ncbi:HEAT repeat domain-containing protein [Thermomonospora cellulosilytica]|uniref:HEAT repeat protein n=1 Tax=Thermomonospora cellulosilytica TaxID=1411118 RepID=A0A7W3R9B7_9ACTN|nr:HEAT repeat domain-containing protein [Thermomonospora cellulosilytica]MBA9004185.1 HEAT repeat protein [Thermomonospora cellulosilytica]
MTDWPALVAAAADRAGERWELAGRLVDAARDRQAAEQALTALTAAPPALWPRLDDELRAASAYHATGRWRVVVGGPRPLAALLAACSRNGREREWAVRSEAVRTDPRLLPVLMIRTADWAPPVREQARRTLDEMLAAPGVLSPEQAATVLGVAVLLRARLRGDHAFTAVARALAAAPDATLAAARAATDLRTRRAAHQIWLDSGRAGQDALVHAALTEIDPVSRVRCAAAVARTAARERDAARLERLLGARCARVRVEALTGLVEIGRPEAGVAFLRTRSTLLRATAQWAVRRAGEDPAGLYRAAVSAGSEADSRTGEVSPGAVAGLGECGTADDVDLLLPLLGHGRPRVRAEAVRAVRRLGGPMDPIAAMLTDPAPAVVRAVTRALRGEPGLPLTGRLWELLNGERPRHVRLGAHRLLRSRDAWTRVEADLVLITDPDPELAARGRADLVAWMRRDSATAYTPPSPAARERIRTLLTTAAPALGPDRTRLLRWLVETSRPA